MILLEAVVYYGYFYSTKQVKLIAVTQIICPINPEVFTIWSFSEKKKFAKDMVASESCIQQNFSKWGSLYTMLFTRQWIGKATEIDIISHFPPAHDV